MSIFLVNSGRICGRGATVLYSNFLLSRSKFTLCYLLKIEWLVTDVSAVGSPDIAEWAILGVILAGRFFGHFRSYLWSGSRFVM